MHAVGFNPVLDTSNRFGHDSAARGCVIDDDCATARNGSRPSSLGWSTRMRIALDAARGLEYLHEFVSPPIIHRDFNSSTVLLGENFSAKISDFGLAKLGSDKMYGQVFTRVLGTSGYVAPE